MDGRTDKQIAAASTVLCSYSKKRAWSTAVITAVSCKQKDRFWLSIVVVLVFETNYILESGYFVFVIKFLLFLLLLI